MILQTQLSLHQLLQRGMIKVHVMSPVVCDVILPFLQVPEGGAHGTQGPGHGVLEPCDGRPP